MEIKIYPRSILVIQLAGLGDMVMATPAIKALRYIYSESKIYLLTNQRSADIVKGAVFIDKIFILKGLKNIFTILRRLRGYRFDVVINLYRLYSFQGAMKMFLLFWAIGGKYWVGRDTDGRGFFYHLKVPERLPDKKHEIEYKLDIVRILGGKIKNNIDLTVEYDHKDEDFVNRFMNKNGIDQRDILIAINCSTFRSSRNWTVEGYSRLADYIIDRFKAKVAFLGVEKDRDLFSRIKNSMRYTPFCFIGVFTVRELTSFLKRCRLLISPDSGTVHIASALKVPMVVLFGPGEYERYRPYGNEGRTIIIKKNVDCAPCFKWKCKNKKCMELITPDEVFEAVRQLFEKSNV